MSISLYQEELMDHYRHPRNKGVLEKPDFSSGTCNPSCGDSVEICGIIHDGIITELKFQGKGCVISQAAASMLTVAATKKPLELVMAFDAPFMQELVGIELGPNRLKCALLALEALHKGLAQYLAEAHHAR